MTHARNRFTFDSSAMYIAQYAYVDDCLAMPATRGTLVKKSILQCYYFVSFCSWLLLRSALNCIFSYFILYLTDLSIFFFSLVENPHGRPSPGGGLSSSYWLKTTPMFLSHTYAWDPRDVRDFRELKAPWTNYQGPVTKKERNAKRKSFTLRQNLKLWKSGCYILAIVKYKHFKHNIVSQFVSNYV